MAASPPTSPAPSAHFFRSPQDHHTCRRPEQLSEALNDIPFQHGLIAACRQHANTGHFLLPLFTIMFDAANEPTTRRVQPMGRKLRISGRFRARNSTMIPAAPVAIRNVRFWLIREVPAMSGVRPLTPKQATFAGQHTVYTRFYKEVRSARSAVRHARSECLPSARVLVPLNRQVNGGKARHPLPLIFFDLGWLHPVRRGGNSSVTAYLGLIRKTFWLGSDEVAEKLIMHPAACRIPLSFLLVL